MAPRDWVPPKMTSSILPLPRSCLELVSPSTQRMESEMFDLPEPFGPISVTIFPLCTQRDTSSMRGLPW